MQLFLDESDEHVNGDRDPDLSLDGIVAGAKEVFDSQAGLQVAEGNVPYRAKRSRMTKTNLVT